MKKKHKGNSKVFQNQWEKADSPSCFKLPATYNVHVIFHVKDAFLINRRGHVFKMNP